MALHIALVYALLHGLARQIVQIVTPPLQTKIIEQARTAQPQRAPPPPPVKLAPPPTPFIPPPEIHIQAPVQRPPTITVPPVVAPAPPAPAPAPSVTPAVTKPAVVLASSCAKPQYPAVSRREGETGTVVLSFLVDVDGRVVESKVERSSGFQRLDEAARAALALCQFRPATTDGTPTRAWARLNYIWQLE